MRSLLLLLLVLAVKCNALRTRPMDVNSARIAPAASEISGCAGISNQRDCSERKCHWCSKDALSVCIHSTVLSRLAKDAYRCSPSEESARPVDITAAQIINPADPCDGKDQKACDADDQCTWCKSAAVPSSCYTRAQSKYLPPAVFTCDKPAPSYS